MKMRIVLSLLAAGVLAVGAATAFADPVPPPPDDNGIGTSPSYDVCIGEAPAPCGIWVDVDAATADARARVGGAPNMVVFVQGYTTCSDAIAAAATLWPGAAVVFEVEQSFRAKLATSNSPAAMPAMMYRRAPAPRLGPPPAVVSASFEWAADPLPPAPPAAVASTLESDPGGVIASLLAAAKAGQWRLLAGLILSILVWAARRWGANLVPWLATDRGGAVLVLLLALLGGLGTSLAGDGPFGISLLVNSLSMAFTAAGGYAVVKKILAPSDAPAAT